MLDKLFNKKFDLSDRVIDYVIEKSSSYKAISLEDIILSTENNLVVVDTKNTLLNKNLEAFDKFDDDNKLLIALVSENIINNIYKRKFNKGFIRSTTIEFDCSFIIKDESEVYIFGNESEGIEVDSKYAKFLFQLVNHFIWSDSTFEICKGEFREIKDNRNSILMPDVSKNTCSELSLENYICTSNTSHGKQAICFKNSEIINYENGYLTDKNLSGYLDEKGIFFAKVYQNCYLPLKDSKYVLRKTFSKNRKLIDYIGKSIELINGETIQINENESIKKIEYFDLNKLMSKDILNEINWEKYVTDFKGFALNLDVNVEAKPIVLDDTYKLHSNYKYVEKLNDTVEKTILKIEKIFGNDKKHLKQINLIKSESKLVNKISLINKFIELNEIGIKELKNKSDDLTIYFDNNKIKIPSEIIGKLVTKSNKNFIATSLDRLDDANKWISENEIEADVILYAK